jgi:hypothetical protein
MKKLFHGTSMKARFMRFLLFRIISLISGTANANSICSQLSLSSNSQNISQSWSAKQIESLLCFPAGLQPVSVLLSLIDQELFRA